MKNPVINFQFPDKLKTLFSILIFIGAVTFCAGLLLDKDRIWHAFLTAGVFVLFLSLGGVFFTAIQHVSKAGWSVNIRRLMEGFGTYLPFAGVLALALLFSGDSLYSWFNRETVATDPLLQHKSAYLNWPFFLIRLLACFGIWIFFSKKLTHFSLKQDKTGEDRLTHKSLSYSVGFLLLFAVSFSFFSFDALMSLEPHWFSTIFPLYNFSGLFQSFISALILIVIYFRRTGVLDKNLVNENHLHDLGKFLLGMTIFWAYIAFSQYMLIWYANLPEETVYYLHRSKGSWKWLSISLILFKFVVPFLFLLPRWVKRDEGALIFISVLILIMQYVDVYWMVYLQFDQEHIRFGLMELGLLAGFVGLFLFSLFNFFSRHPLVPMQDPRQKESSSHIVTY